VGADDEIAIRTVNLAKVYPSGQSHITVFRDLSVEVPAGQRVAVIGESGAGKSSLLHLLGGLDRATDGEIYYGSQALSRMNDRELAAFRNRHLGFVWQTASLLPEFTALENVMMPLLIRGIGQAEAREPAMENLRQVGLEARHHHRTGELSGGEQQRVALARALVTQPRVLLADEPTGSLDHRTGEAIMDLLAELHRERRLTSILVTHNLSFAQRCDRIYSLQQGRLEPFPESGHPIEQPLPYTGKNGSSYV
jgi:lipoprotein-releasing system ATP-binding protein